MKLSIIIPVYNEKGTIKELISRVKNVDLGDVQKEIIVVDDFSIDGTRGILEGIKGIKLSLHDKNMGKGFGIKTGVARATGDIIIVQDADLEYSPEEYVKLIRPIINGRTNVVYGSRLLGRRNPKGKFMFYVGGRVVTFFTNFLYWSSLTDEPTCYKVFHKSLRSTLLGAEGIRFEWEPEVTAKLLRKGEEILEVPISYNPRNKKEGKHIGIGDGAEALWTLLKWRFKKIDS